MAARAEWQSLPLFAQEDLKILDSQSNASGHSTNTSHLSVNASDLGTNAGELPALLLERIAALTSKARKEKLWPVILWLCAIRPFKADELASLLNRKVTHLKTGHLSKMRDQQGLLEYLHPEVVNHPEQAYRTTVSGVSWLQKEGIEIC